MTNRLLFFTISGVLLVACFLFFTSGIPLIQWGWVEAWGMNKRPYVKTTRMAVLLLAGVLTLTYFVSREAFYKLWLIRIIEFLRKRLTLAVCAGFFIYVSIMSAVGFMRHQALETRGFDLGIFSQAVWNTLQGNFLYSSIKGGICLLGDHVSPILAALSPVYSLWPDPRTLIFIQAIAAAASLFLIAKIAYERLESGGAALAFSFLYFMYFPTRGALHEDFHPEVLVEPFILLSFIFLERKRTIPFLLCLLVVASGKENMLGVTFILGFYALIFKGMRIVGPVIMVLSVSLFFFEVAWLVPKLSGQEYLYQGSYQSLLKGQSTAVFARLFGADSWEYLAKVFLPFLFMPFFHPPTLLLTLPIFLQNVISENEVMRSFNYHYTTGMTPFVFISAIYGYHTLVTKFDIIRRFRSPLLLLILFAGLLKIGASEYYYYWQSREKITPHIIAIRDKMRSIDSSFSILTHNNFIPQVANRREVYQFDYRERPTKAELAEEKKVDYVIFDSLFWEAGTQPLPEVLGELREAGYETVFQRQDFYIFKRTEITGK